MHFQKLLLHLDRDESVATLSEELSVNKMTINRWRKNHGKIEQFGISTSEKTVKSRRSMKEPVSKELNEVVYLWLTQTRQKETPIIKRIFCQKVTGDSTQ